MIWLIFLEIVTSHSSFALAEEPLTLTFRPYVQNQPELNILSLQKDFKLRSRVQCTVACTQRIPSCSALMVCSGNFSERCMLLGNLDIKENVDASFVNNFEPGCKVFRPKEMSQPALLSVFLEQQDEDTISLTCYSSTSTSPSSYLWARNQTWSHKSDNSSFLVSGTGSESMALACVVVNVHNFMTFLSSEVIVRNDGDCHGLEGYTGDVVSVLRPWPDEPRVPRLCHIDSEGQGWTVIQRRVDDKTNFTRSWVEYRHGFGDLCGSFWLGLEPIHAITNKTGANVSHELLIEMEDEEGKKAYAQYDFFALSGEDDLYRLSVGTYNGTAGDSLSGYHNGSQFSTWDLGPQMRCSNRFRSGWWYNSCHQANLNGIYGFTGYAKGIMWKTITTYVRSLPYAIMKIRPR